MKGLGWHGDLALECGLSVLSRGAGCGSSAPTQQQGHPRTSAINNKGARFPSALSHLVFLPWRYARDSHRLVHPGACAVDITGEDAP